MRLTVIALFCALASLILGVESGIAAESVLKVRLGIHPDKTRFVIETSAVTEFNMFTLPNPDRVIVDLKDLVWADAPEEPPGGLITGYRHGLLDEHTLRIVLNTQAPVTANAGFIPAREGFGPRFVLDMNPAQATAAVKKGGVPIPPVSPLKKSRDLPVIALDAGHGGIDPGAVGIGDILEKKITLNVARALKKELEGTGQYKVFLTRGDDTFIPLRERVTKAREAGADLFVSLHADSISKRDVRGLSVYTLSETASDREAAMLADKENRVDEIAGVPIAHEHDDVANILIDLAQRDTMNLSRFFARTLVSTLQGDILLLPSPQRSAGFAVLTAPDMPSVLIEMGYLSSPKDSRMLNSGEHHKHLAQKIAQAIDAFFERQ